MGPTVTQARAAMKMSEETEGPEFTTKPGVTPWKIDSAAVYGVFLSPGTLRV